MALHFLLEVMPAISLQRNEISFNAAISACEPLGCWEHAVFLLTQMPIAPRTKLGRAFA